MNEMQTWSSSVKHGFRSAPAPPKRKNWWGESESEGESEKSLSLFVHLFGIGEISSTHVKTHHAYKLAPCLTYSERHPVVITTKTRRNATYLVQKDANDMTVNEIIRIKTHKL